jgi:hypothetical protein
MMELPLFDLARVLQIRVAAGAMDRKDAIQFLRDRANLTPEGADGLLEHPTGRAASRDLAKKSFELRERSL